MTGFPRTGGRLRRRIDIATAQDGAVTGWVEDDFHHFGVRVEHDGTTVTRIDSRAERAPWSTCPAASVPLQALVGKPLVERASDIGALIEMRVQCTHMFDLAGLVLAHAFARRDHRAYEVLVPDRAVLGITGNQRTMAPGWVELWRDGDLVLRWLVADPLITAPAEVAGQSLHHGFRQWTEAMLIDTAEAAHIVRRAVLVAGGRMVDLDLFAVADDQSSMPPVCHSYSLAQRKLARRNVGTSRDYSDSGTGMLAHAGQPFYS